MVLAAMFATLWVNLMEKGGGNAEENHDKQKGEVQERSWTKLETWAPESSCS